MKLLTSTLHAQLLRNGTEQAPLKGSPDERDFRPVVKLFTPDAACTWLLTEIDPDDPDIAFGLCDLGMGYPELGSVSLSALQSVRGRMGLPVERDLHFRAEYTIADYALAALNEAQITECPQALEQAASARRKRHD